MKIMHKDKRKSSEHYFIVSPTFFLCTCVIVLFLFTCIQKNVQAASGNIYSCKINPSYSHPVTGQVEDAGGSSSSTTGQGMVEGAVGSKGILEVTDGGEYFLTFRLGLMDYSSKQSFQVQNINDSGWTDAEPMVTGSGSDSSGKTADMRIKVPSESCIVRCSMYVEPMGRNVIFYFYPSEYTSGNTTDMKAEMVTGTSSEHSDNTSDTSSAVENTSKDGESTSEKQSSESMLSSASTENTQNTASSSQQSAQGTVSSTEDSLKDTQGLSLSTAADATKETADSEKQSNGQMIEIIIAVCIGMTISGLFLLFAGAGIVYVFRKNWKRWGEEESRLPSEEESYPEESIFMADGFGEADSEEGIWDSEGVVHEDFSDISDEETEIPDEVKEENQDFYQDFYMEESVRTEEGEQEDES